MREFESLRPLATSSPGARTAEFRAEVARATEAADALEQARVARDQAAAVRAEMARAGQAGAGGHEDLEAALDDPAAGTQEGAAE